jgi:hypothetical protein
MSLLLMTFASLAYIQILIKYKPYEFTTLMIRDILTEISFIEIYILSFLLISSDSGNQQIGFFILILCWAILVIQVFSIILEAIRFIV